MFKCKTPTCAISISKAEFPAAMPCPVCQNMLTAESSLNDEELTLLQNLPYVIAYPLQKTLEDKHAWTKINLFKDTFLNYLKYLGLLTASEFFNSPFKDKRMVALFQQSLAEPSFGTWNHYIRETLNFLKEKEHSFFIPELPEYYEKVETGKKRKLYKGEIEFIDGNGDVQIKKQEATAIGMLINFRNRYLGHGLTLDATTAEKLWEEYSPMFFEILRELKFTLDYKMYKYENDETFLLQSAQIVQKENNRKSNQVWLESPSGEVMDILPFYVVPGELTIRKEDKEQILAYESYTGKSIKFFSPEGTEKQTSGRILEKLNLLLRDKQKEKAYSPEEFTKEIFLSRVAEENKLILNTLIAEKKVIPEVYVHREDMEIKLREWIGARANIFVIAAEAGSGKTNLLVEMQKQYTERELPTLLIRAGRMEKTTIHEQLCYLLNIDEYCNLNQYPAIGGTQEAPTFVLIDGLNEAHESEKLWTELFEISKHFESGSLKFVVTSRANTAADINRYKITTEQESFLYGNSKDKENLVRTYTHWLTALSMEEMKQAWEYYVAKDKGKFKPQFDFDDLATFDRALYNQISNPLVLRLFLETYQGKNLPKKGKQHLDIWSDWLSTFSQQEQDFFKDLADAIWDKGENELLLEDVLNNANLKSYFTTDQLNAPYPRLRNMGWISRYVKDLNTCVGFTVEGALIHILGVKINSTTSINDETSIHSILQENNCLKLSAYENFLCIKAESGNLELSKKIIEFDNSPIEICLKPLLLFIKTFDCKIFLENFLTFQSKKTWVVLEELHDYMVDLELHDLKKDLLCFLVNYNNFDDMSAISLGLKTCLVLDKNESTIYLDRIKECSIEIIEKDPYLVSVYGDLQFEYGNFNIALKCQENCLRYEIIKLGELHPYTATTFFKIGWIYEELGEFDKALENTEKSLEIRIKTIGTESLEVAASYNNIGKVYSEKQEYNKAHEYYQKSYDIRLKLLGGTHTYVARSLNNIGTALLAKGELDNSLIHFNKHLEINLKSHGHKNTDTALAYANLGAVFSEKKEYNKSLDYFQKSLEIYSELYGLQHPKIGTLYHNIGCIWMSAGDLDKSFDFLFKSVEIKQIFLDEKKHDLASTYIEIAKAYKIKKEFNKTEEYLVKALEIRKECFGNNSKIVANTYYILGENFKEKKEYENAINYFEKSLSVETNFYSSQSDSVAKTLIEVGLLKGIIGELDQALTAFNKSLQIQILKKGTHHQDIAIVYGYIGIANMRKGEFKEALKSVSKSLEIKINSLGEDHEDIAVLYYQIAICHHNTGVYKDAIENYLKGFKIQKIGIYPYKIAACFESLNDKINALHYFIMSAELSRNDSNAGPDPIQNSQRLAKEIGKESELPDWIKTYI
jgi:tetratricopeptide (TPR) repeat protein